MTQDFEIRALHQPADIRLLSCIVIIDAEYLVAVVYEPFA
jgi:hypothetical protein